MHSEQNSVVGAPRQHEEDDPGPGIVAQLEGNAALERLHVAEMRLCLDEPWFTRPGDHRVPSTRVSIPWQRNLALERER